MTEHPARNSLAAFVAAMILATLAGCDTPGSTASDAPSVTAVDDASQPRKIGVLLVSHGSHSRQWCRQVMEIEDAVRDEILADPRIDGIYSALMEYSEPSIATQLKRFDEAGYTDVILVPLLLTVSSHSFDDIPTIIGQKQDHATGETLRLEGVETYTPKARVVTAPLLDFPSVLSQNLIRRVKQMSENPSDEGVVLVAYGSEPYEEEWTALLDNVSDEVTGATGIDCIEHAWCGHVVRFNNDPTVKAIRQVLERKQTALVVPVLVAVDEMFQGRIIGGAIERVDQPERIVYRHDSILPDENVNRWVIDIARKMAEQITEPTEPGEGP